MRLEIKKLTRYRTQPSKTHEIRYNCHLCGDVDGKLYANFKKGLWTCFKCGASGSILPRDMAQVQGEEKPAFKGEKVREFQWYQYPDIRGSGLQYLEDRNIPEVVAWAWGVRSGRGDAVGRLLFPVKYLTGGGLRILFRVAHATTDLTFPKELQSGSRKPWILTWGTDDNPIFANTPAVEEGRLAGRTAVIVEGAADALRLASTALSDNQLRDWTSIVCLWGKHLSEDTAFDLVRMFDHFYVLLDREDGLSSQGEQVASMKILQSLSAIADGHVMRHSWNRTDDGRAADPAELTDEAALNVLRTALKRTGG